MRLLDSDPFPASMGCATGQLDPIAHHALRWMPGYAVCVVLTSGGYPGGDYTVGYPITGIEEAEEIEGVKVFHAATAEKFGQPITNGGRVLNVTAFGATLQEARERAYAGVQRINFQDMRCRTDIGAQEAVCPSS